MESAVGETARSSNQSVDGLLSEKDYVPGGLGELLDTGRDVDGVTDQGELQLACAADRSGDHHTGVDPDADPQHVAESLSHQAVNQNSGIHGRVGMMRKVIRRAEHCQGT